MTISLCRAAAVASRRNARLASLPFRSPQIRPAAPRLVTGRLLSTSARVLGKSQKVVGAESDLPAHVGTAGFYKKHVLIATGTSTWDKKIEDTDAYFAALQKALKDHDIRVTASDEPSLASTSDARTLLVLPDNIRFPSVAASDFPALAKQLTSTATPLQAEVDRHRIQILVCTHGARDCRCGDLGVPLLKALKDEVAARPGMDARVHVQGVSHIGGHKFAGNAIVYPSGDWYGLLKSEDAKALIDSALNGDLIHDKWRGRMGLSKEEQQSTFRQWTSTSAGGGEAASSASDGIAVTYILPDNTAQELSVPLEKNLMEFGRDNELPNIEGTCGGQLECATCHVIVDPAFAEKLPPVTDEEEDMLEYAIGRTENSRLSCQLKATRDLHGLRLMIPTAVPRNFPSMSDYRSAWQAKPPAQRIQQRAFASGTPPPAGGSDGSSSSSPPPPPPTKRDFKSLSREYGPIALGVYLSLSFMTFCACLTSITVLGVDQAQISGWWKTIKTTLGFPPAPGSGSESEASSMEPSDRDAAAAEAKGWSAMLPEWTRNPSTRHMLTSVLLAMGMTKLFLPVKLAITMAITPMVAKRLRSFGFQLGQKGGYRDAATIVRTEVKDRRLERKLRKEGGNAGHL
ncbi:hypothetical protein HKX48_001865 [Thoreauomyces humboldtii]|nr:hypothetical protein HKX48_001865 [Thoreauomyces humboldtii]